LPARGIDFHDLKADAEALLIQLGQAHAVTWRRSERPFLHPGRSADLHLGGRCVGWIGHLHPALLRQLDSPSEIIVLELALAAMRPRAPVQLTVLSKQPSVRRDLALVVADSVDYAEVEAAVHGLALPALRDLRLFDVYRGQSVPEGSKSLAIGLIFQEDSRTLAEGEVDAWVNEVRQRLTAATGASWRG
jgi:phenylalanyl-tRNA synthetase beta chain